jgi:hypothetical protein
MAPRRHDRLVETEPSWSDATLIMDVLLDVRTRVVRIQALLEEDDEEEGEDDS